eukprot:COSAG02_NODE_82_length_39723_cov_247.146650_21_plen_108_part_00
MVCLDYKNPKIDPRLLDPKFAFEEVDGPAGPTDVFAKSKSKRKRDGYEEGNYTQHKKCTVSACTWLCAQRVYWSGYGRGNDYLPILLVILATAVRVHDQYAACRHAG